LHRERKTKKDDRKVASMVVFAAVGGSDIGDIEPIPTTAKKTMFFIRSPKKCCTKF
jgi:hypothetical protein